MLMNVRCRIAPGQSPEVWLTEISLTGCQIGVREGLLTEGRYVVIKAQGLEGLPGTVRWSLGEAAGIEFEQPLHPAVLAHLLGGSQTPAYTPVEPGSRSSQRAPTRVFGRRSCL